MLIDSNKDKEQIVFGLPIVGDERDLPKIHRFENIKGIIFAVGDNFARMDLCRNILSLIPNASFPITIRSSAVISPNAILRLVSALITCSILNSNYVI